MAGLGSVPSVPSVPGVLLTSLHSESHLKAFPPPSLLHESWRVGAAGGRSAFPSSVVTLISLFCAGL